MRISLNSDLWIDANILVFAFDTQREVKRMGAACTVKVY
jgi:hypothetical protein